jgi:hypothetical protein
MLVVAAIICYACTEPASVGHDATWLGADTIDPRGPKGCEATYEAWTLAHIITPFMVLGALHGALVKPMPSKAQAASPPVVQKGDRFLLSGRLQLVA